METRNPVHQDYFVILTEFRKKADRLKLISELTGLVFLDPVIIPGSTDPVEREFVAEAIRVNGKNPLTNEPMTLDELNRIATDSKTREAVETLIGEFLVENKKHPDYKKIEEAIKQERYVLVSDNRVPPASAHRQPADPDADDLIAITSAQHDLQADRQQSAPVHAQRHHARNSRLFQPAPQAFNMARRSSAANGIHLPRGFTIIADPVIVSGLNQRTTTHLNVHNLGFDNSPQLFNFCIRNADGTVGVDFFRINTDRNITLNVWDVAGMERFTSILAGSVRRSNVVLYFGDNESITRGINMIGNNPLSRHFVIRYENDSHIAVVPCADVNAMLNSSEVVCHVDEQNLVRGFSAALYNLCCDAFSNPMIPREAEVHRITRSYGF
ncbi:hypothetical protein AQUSIP_07450 [Aquicella siphonis]|uniref:Uncharacterized protein n=1 Tax=Aquicella siphonis TaxID=254247 RepID=A0A5E4PFP9_9COXI|nr:hypothetical protein [Aquicella siphonis]VVC75455.1 hypothetical protein AQUSIP_07450 [Aquicella siphonis]